MKSILSLLLALVVILCMAEVTFAQWGWGMRRRMYGGWYYSLLQNHYLFI